MKNSMVVSNFALVQRSRSYRAVLVLNLISGTAPIYILARYAFPIIDRPVRRIYTHTHLPIRGMSGV